MTKKTTMYLIIGLVLVVIVYFAIAKAPTVPGLASSSSGGLLGSISNTVGGLKNLFSGLGGGGGGVDLTSSQGQRGHTLGGGSSDDSGDALLPMTDDGTDTSA